MADEKGGLEESCNAETNIEDGKEKNALSGMKYAIPLILIFVLIYGYMFSEFKQIPGPMYGGDYYFHYGIVNHIFNGNMPWTCPQFQGEWAFYPWLMHLSVAVFGWVTGDLLKSYILYFPLFVVASSGLVVFLLGKELFKKTEFALLTTLAFMGIRLYIDYIPSNFTPTLMTPLFFLTTLKAHKTPEMKWIVLAGLSFGLFILSHASTLPAGGLFLFMLLIASTFEGRVKFGFNSESAQWDFNLNKDGMSEAFKKALKIIMPISVIGFVIGLLYWGPVIGVYHFKILNPWNEFTQPDLDVSGGEYAKNLILGTLFSIDSLPAYPQSFIISVLTLAGLVLALTGQKNQPADKSSTFMVAAFFAGLVGYFHYLVTNPLLHTSYAPFRFDSFMMSPAAFLLGIYGVYRLYGMMKSDKSRKTVLILAYALFIVASAININIQYNADWAKVGRTPSDQSIAELSNWVDANTDKNAVFLSHDELSFALNGLTGRKVLFERRTHANPYVDLNQRIADGGVILFGNDSQKTLELLKKYNVSYVYWDFRWMATINEHPGFAFSTPMMTEPRQAGYLESYNVNFTRAHTYLDPAWRDTYRKYDVLAIMPAKMDIFQPWSDEFNKHVKLTKEVYIRVSEDQALPAYRIYSIDYSTF